MRHVVTTGICLGHAVNISPNVIFLLMTNRQQKCGHEATTSQPWVVPRPHFSTH
jgi:hypothetical protein